MNTWVPGEQTVVAFWIVMGAMLVILLAMVAYFRKRGWL
jgi:Mg2+ and Co2+ transporter CorA